MITLQRFKHLASAYGADIGRWPADDQAEARRLYSSSAEARAMIEAESALDEQLATWRVEAETRHIARIVRETARLTPQGRGQRQAERWGLPRWVWAQFAGAAAAGILGFVVGWSGIGPSDMAFAEPVDLSAYVVGIDLEEDLTNDS